MSKIDITISERLKDCRKSKHISLDKASKEIGVSKQTLIDYEAGRGNPSLTTIQSICCFYGITPNYLICGNDDNVTKMEEPLKRKSYSLISLIVDGDISFNQIDCKIRFNNEALKSVVSRCHAILSNEKNNISKLEAIEVILKYLDSLNNHVNDNR